MSRKPSAQGGPMNGYAAASGFSGPGDGRSKPRSAPWTLKEALPYSPQTSVLPFNSDLIPQPTLGSAAIGPGLSDLFDAKDFEALNREGAGQSQLPKQVHLAAEHIIHSLKANQRTKYKFPDIPKGSSESTSGPSITANLSPLTRLVFEKAPDVIYQTSPPPKSETPTSPNGKVKSSPTPKPKSPVVTKVPLPKPVQMATTNAQAQKSNFAKIEVAIPIKKYEESPTISPALLQKTPEVSLVKPKPPKLISTTPIPVPVIPQPKPVTPISSSVPVPAPAAAPPAAPVQTPVPVPVPAPAPVVPPVQTPVPVPVIPTTSSQPVQPRPTPDPTPKEAPLTPVRPLSQGERSSITIDLNHSGGVNRDDYVEVPDSPDEPLSLSTRKRKREGHDGQDLFATGLDQRQRADTALDDLDRLTREIFRAIAHVLGRESGYSHIAVLTNDQEASLTAGTHQKVQAAIQKVITLGSFEQVPVDELLQFQKLSEAGMKQMETSELKIDESWGESEVLTWSQLLPDVELALKAARTALRTMSGGREDKQLYSEETIQHCLDVFRAVVDSIIVPTAELRGSGPGGSLFKLLLPHKKAIGTIFTTTQKLFSLLAVLVSSIELSERVLNTLEFVASQLIFVENAYYEKDSVVGVQKYDGIRLVAMDMLCSIFLSNPQQRQGIFDEILTSLEKLPVGKQSARQFKLAEGGSVQPVSALIMRLVQSSSGRVTDAKGRGSDPVMKSLEDENDQDAVDEPMTDVGALGKIFSTINSEEEAATQPDTAIRDLEDTSKPLVDTTKRDANYVVQFIVSRALKSTKSGDTPYRNLLDLFIEDFTTCLDSPDWPAAELLLRLFFYMMVKLSEGEKTQAPAKNMALEVLGTMCAAISKLRSHVRKAASSMEGSGSDELSRFIADVADSALEKKNRPEHLVSWSGPFRATLEYLEERCSSDPHLKSSISYIIAEWANRTTAACKSYQQDTPERDQEFGRIAYRLRMMIEDRRWLTNEYEFKAVSVNQAKLSYLIIVLRSPFCDGFDAILQLLLKAMASDQATVRSKALKSINQVLETDPSILAKSSVVQLILQCSSDSSTQVRDSALGLIGKSISLNPSLESSMTPTIIERFLDSGVGVRKRALKLARDVYLRNNGKAIRSAIASGMLHRVQDPDEGVRDLARQMLEEIWFVPFYHADSTAAFQTSLTDQVALMIQTVKSGNATAVMDKVLQSILGSQGKAAEGPFGVCSKLVANMFNLIDNLDSEDPTIPAGRDALEVLMIFAKADPKLFTFEQIRLLKPHLSSLNTAEDLAVFRAVVAIYRRVLPQLSGTLHAQFLQDVRGLLLATVGKVGRSLLDDVVASLWIICKLLGNITPLVSVARSCLENMQTKLRGRPLDGNGLKLFERYSPIIGMIGKHCDLEDQLQIFKDKFPKYQGTSVAKLMVDSLIPFAASSQPQEGRKYALDAIGLICQSWPRNYVSANVYTTFQEVFNQRVPILESMILRSFKEFLFTEEKRSEAASGASKVSVSSGKKRELTVMGGTNYDDVASATTQRFLAEITRISLASEDEHAFLALEVLGTINRQGLVHPKETCITFMTLETSTVQKISELAYQEHRSLHEKHETVLEREYVKAVQSAFAYQRDIVKDIHGAIPSTWQPKLHLIAEVQKISKSKNRQKFLEKLVSQIDFDPAKLVVRDEIPYHVLFSQFLVENLAFLDYMTVGELQLTVNAMEKLVTSTGSSVAQTIESEILNIRMDIDQAADSEMGGITASTIDIEPKRMRQLTAASMILLSVWEARTFLRRLYGLGIGRRENKPKAQSKDLSKAPVKIQGVSYEKFWDDMGEHMTGFQSQDKMLQKCKAFVELMNVDKEFKVADEDEDLNGENPATPSEDEEDDDAPGTGRGRKRKAGNTPGGRKKRQRSTSRARQRGRPRKPSMDVDADGDFEDDWM